MANLVDYTSIHKTQKKVEFETQLMLKLIMPDLLGSAGDEGGEPSL